VPKLYGRKHDLKALLCRVPDTLPLPCPCPFSGFENEATAKFCGGCGKPVGDTTDPARSVVAAPSRVDGAEHRHLTEMFCDLVGSTALASRLDPEDLRETIGSHNKCVAETVTQYDGFVAKYMGDGVLAHFGYPMRTRTIQNALCAPALRCSRRCAELKHSSCCESGSA
jgi:hypothetical protein